MSKATKTPVDDIEATEESHDAKVARLMGRIADSEQQTADTDAEYKSELRRLQGERDAARSELKREMEEHRNRRMEFVREKIKNCQPLDSADDAA